MAKHIGDLRKQFVAIWAAVSGGGMGVQLGLGAKNQRAGGARVGSANHEEGGGGVRVNMVRMAGQVGPVGEGAGAD